MTSDSVDPDASNDESDPFEALFSATRREQERQAAAYRELAASPDYADLLRDAMRTVAEDYDPRPGELVQWRRYMQARPFPAAGKPGIVLDVLEIPVNVDDRGNPVAYPRDVRVGYLDGEANLRTFLTSRRRLMKWTDASDATDREARP